MLDKLVPNSQHQPFYRVSFIFNDFFPLNMIMPNSLLLFHNFLCVIWGLFLMQKYRLYLKRVSGVQVQPAGNRGKFSRNSSMDTGQHHMATLMPQHLGNEMCHSQLPNHPQHPERLDERESLHLQMPMGHIKAEPSPVGFSLCFFPLETCPSLTALFWNSLLYCNIYHYGQLSG